MITKPTETCHWTEKHGYCTLITYSPADPNLHGRVRRKAKKKREQELFKLFKEEYGYYPTIVMSGRDGIALGPIYQKGGSDALRGV